ncbi:MAG: hypothetical protein FWC27_10290 [Firmicutes bacterium]|nr:hypothetical protein [Bacillota bacterium]
MQQRKLAIKCIPAAAIALALLGTLLVSLPVNPTLAAYIAPGAGPTGKDVHYVDDWASFLAAWSDNAGCEKIVLLNDVAAPVSASTGNGSLLGSTNATGRSRALEIDGQGYFLNLYNQRMYFSGASSVNYDPVFDIHDIRLRKNTAQTYMAGTTNDNDNGILFEQSSGGTGRWIYRAGNVTVNRGDANHFALISGSHLILYGVNRIATTTECAHVSSVYIEPGSEQYITEAGRQDYSIFYFISEANTDGTAYRYGGGNFEVGEDAVVVLTYTGMDDLGNPISGVTGTFPAVYNNYIEIIINEDARFASTMYGDAVRFNNSGNKFIAKAGSIVNLTTLRLGRNQAVDFAASNCTFLAEPGSNIYIVGNTDGGASAGIIDLNTTGRFILDSPASFDIRNKNTSSGTNNVFGMSGSGSRIEIYNTDIDIWYLNSNTQGPSDLSCMDVVNYTLVGASGNAQSTAATGTTEPGLRTASGTASIDARSANYRRITGMNQLPEVLFDDEGDSLVSNPVDADKFVRVRALLGWVPHDDGVDEYGNVEMIPVYASGKQGVGIWITGEDGCAETADWPGAVPVVDPADGLTKYFLAADADGYLLLPPDYPTAKFGGFLQAGTLLSAKANRGGRMGEEFTARVLDVTPPAPARINGAILRGQTAITGRGGEPGAKAAFEIIPIGGGPAVCIDAGTVADGAGGWKIEDLLSAHGVDLQTGDLVRIFMKDSYGNENPWPADVNYHDAIFLKAAQFEVQELPARLHVRQIVLDAAGSTANAEENRSVPEAGYVTVLKRDSSDAALEAVNMFVNSGTGASTPYSFFTYPPVSGIDNLLLEVAEPQYYKYAGCRISDTESANAAAALSPGAPGFAAGAQTEKWVTLYVKPRDNGTAYYAGDAVDNGLGGVHLPVPPAMSLSAGRGIGYIANNGAIRLTAQNDPQAVTVTAQAWGDGINGGDMNWSSSGLALGPAALAGADQYTFTIPPASPNGSMRVRAESVDDPALGMEFTIRVTDLILMHTDDNTEMTPNYTLYAASSPSAPTDLHFTASKAVDWWISSQTGVRAALGSANGTANTLTVPANYRGTVNIRVESGSLRRNFRVVVRR